MSSFDACLAASLLLGHVVADFYLQTERVAREKGQNFRALGVHGAHILLAQFVAALPVWGWPLFPAILGLTMVHLAIDATVKPFLSRRWAAPLTLFFLDQALHIATLWLVWMHVRNGSLAASAWFQVPSSALRALAQAGIVSSGYIFLGTGGTVVVRTVLGRFPQLIPGAPGAGAGAHGDEHNHAESPAYAMGREIGTLERYLAALLVLLGHWGALGLVIAAKSLARIKEFEDRDFANYYLLGTLSSLLTAVGVGLAMRWMLRAVS